MDFLGKTLGNYRIDRLLGEGGMGTVYQAYDLSLERVVAIKMIHPHLARQPIFRERFVQEARLMARLDHPGIVRVYVLGKEGDLLFLPMEFIKGGNLRQLLDKLIKEHKWIPLNEALLLVQQLCQVVEYAHQHGVLHRDIKPANLMLKAERTDGLPFRVVLTDLGLAKLLEGLGVTQEGSSLGTPAYMSPEQASGLKTDQRSDVYSLGVLLYELAVGRLPFVVKTITEATRYHTQVQPPAPRSIHPELPEDLEQVILKALEKDPDKRYPSAAALATVLTGNLSSSTEIIGPTDQEQASLITQYQDSIIASSPLAPVSLVTFLGNEPMESRGASVFEAQSVVPSPETRIQIIHKDSTTKVLKLPSGTVTLGRDKDNHIVLDDNRASRRHAQITWDGLEYHVMDLNSSNGTYLENARLLPGISEVLKPNQNLRIGDTWLRIIQPSTKSPSIDNPMNLSGGASVFSNSSAGVVSVAVTPQPLSVEAGGSATVTVSLLNQSPLVDHFSLSLTGIPSAWVTGLTPSLQLMPGQQKETIFNLVIPRNPQSKAGPHYITLKVSSQHDPSQFVDIKLILTIAAYSQFKAELHPQRLRAGQTGSLTISNQGNLEETFTVQFKDDAGELNFQSLHPQPKILEGQSASVEFRTQLSKIRLMGGEKSHAFNAQVSLPKGDPQTLRGEILSRGLFPAWLPPALLLLCCFIAVLGGRFVPPLLFPTPTPTLTFALTSPPTPSTTPEPGAPVIEQWCVYPSDQPPASSTDCPIQLNIEAGKTVTLEWRVSNAEKVVINPLGDQAPSGTISSYIVTQTTTFAIEATNAAQKKIQKVIQVNVYVPTPTAAPEPTKPAVPTTAMPAPPTPTPTPTATPTKINNSNLHIAAPSNIHDNWTEIDSVLTNNNPNALVLVTSNWNPSGPTGVYNNHPIGVWYTGSHWAVFNQDLAAMPPGTSFNVLILGSQ